MSKSLVELKKVVMADIEAQNHTINLLEGDSNPKVREMYLSAVARKEAMEAVLNYTQNGSKLYFEKLED